MKNNPRPVISKGRIDNEDILGINDLLSEISLAENENSSNNGESITSYVNYGIDATKGIFNVFFDYFNFKLSNEDKNTEDYDGVKVINFFKNGDYANNVQTPAPELIDNYCFVISFNGLEMRLKFNSYISNDILFNFLNIQSKTTTNLSGDEVYLALFEIAVAKSRLKGAYITLPSNSYSWEMSELSDMNYDDIFLPPKLMKESKFYVELFRKKGILSRYMLSGAPGMGKTELTRVLTSILNREGVTIIKTNICDLLKEKFELAEALAPSIIVMDDIDLSLGDRNNGAYSDMLGIFLDALDGVNKLSSDVGIIATTNATHLIDIAAQRPGRFNKVMSFDELTEDNIKGIINKALKTVGGDDNEEVINFFTDDKFINFYLDNGCSGSYIYETVRSTKHIMDVTEEKLDIEELIRELKSDMDLLDKKLKSTEIKNSLERKNNSFGFMS